MSENPLLESLWSSTNGEYLKKFWTTTKYQDFIVLGAISGHFPQIKLDLDHKYNIKKDYPVICTVPIPILNGLTLKDEKGRSGIILQEGLRFHPATLGQYFCDLIGYDFATYFDPFELSSSLKEENVKINIESAKLLSYFFHDAVSDGIIHKQNNEVNIIKLRCIHEFEMGFKDFVLAHEYSHVVNDHYDEVKLDFLGKKTEKNHTEVVEVCNKTKIKYPDLEITDEIIKNYSHLQAIENKADVDGIYICLLALIEHIKKGDVYKGFFYLCGCLSFFWYLELTERTQRTLKQGSKWLADPIYKEDLDIQNLLFRSSHPAPLSRYQHAYDQLIYQFGEGNERLEPWLKCCWDVVSLIFDSAWNGNKDLLILLSERAEMKIHHKWEIDIPFSEAVFGVNNIKFSENLS